MSLSILSLALLLVALVLALLVAIGQAAGRVLAWSVVILAAALLVGRL